MEIWSNDPHLPIPNLLHNLRRDTNLYTWGGEMIYKTVSWHQIGIGIYADIENCFARIIFGPLILTYVWQETEND